MIGSRKSIVESLEARQLLTTVSFQNGASGYGGQEDTVLYSREPDVNFGTEGSISPDQQDSNGARQGLLRFNDIIGDGLIPLGAQINSATLVVDVVNDSNSAMQMSLYRMQEDWSEASATWNTFGAIGGVQASEGEASDLPPDAILFEADTTAAEPDTAGIFDVTRSLEYWASGADNFGWMIESSATNGWDFRTKESAQSQRPRLQVDFDVPSSDQFQLLTTALVAAEGDAGESSTATIEVSRQGSLTGAASVSYAVTAGTAGEGDFAASTGTVEFEAGQAFATFEITITGDDELEGLETIEVALSGNGVVEGRGATTVTIGDDDALINEVLANVTPQADGALDETNREFIELIGTPGASLDGYFFVVFDGEEEGDDGSAPDGTGMGIADFVFDLSGQSFGDNGLLVIAPTEWDYAGLAAEGTNIVNTDALDGEGGVLEDFSQTYALIRSSAPLVEGTDYDTVGTCEDDTNQAICEGVGILDQLPAGAELVDSVGVVEGGGSDRDRTLTTAERGHPGIHVHQPTRAPGSQNNVTSDAVSRRIDQDLPNSIGVWFNGDVLDGNPDNGLSYANDTFFVSVVTPDGAVITPGAPNVLRTVFFSTDDQDTQVAEADGSVTVTIERTGDLSEEVSVTYETVDLGSAIAGEDFAPVSETVTFAAGETAKDVTITILGDDSAEGFERFRIDITAVGEGYAITNGRSTAQGAINGEAVITIADANVSTASFQNGTDDYSGTSDAYLDGLQVFDKFGQDPVIRVDQVIGEGEDVAVVVRPQQGLIRFDEMFGDGAGQVPAGSTIFSAFLTVNVQNNASGADVRFFRMLEDWEEVNATWTDPQGDSGNAIQDGVVPDDIEAIAEPDFRVPDAGRAGLNEIPINADTVQSWANGSLDNYGWSIVNNSGSLWAFNSSEAFLLGTERPELTILYTPPEASSAGTFSFASDEFVVSESGTAEITVNRVGGSSGAASIDWSVGAGTGDLDDVGATSGTLSFADGELFKTFTVAINDDDVLEPNETVTLSLSGGDTGRGETSLLIRDNDFDPFAGDILLNEMWINSPGNDPPFEFVELTGTAGVPLGSLYYVAIEGLVGNREGSAEKVVDLGAYSNGANGITILTPDAEDFGHWVSPESTQIDGLGSIAQENVASQNDSTTYMILYSPLTRLATTEFDYDWNNDGALELPAGVTIVDSVGVRVLGAEDQLYGPASNQASFGVSDPDVDAISRALGDNRRNEGDAWYGGDLVPGGDDYLLYETGEAFDLPTAGAALSPSEPNTDPASTPVSLVDVVVNASGTVTATFSGPVSQVKIGNGQPVGVEGAGISITDAAGAALPTIDALPNVTGFGTDTLTLSFTGGGTVNGGLPEGSYRLNFIGNGIIAAGRAVDAAGSGSPSGSFRAVDIGGGTGGPLLGDLDGDGDVDFSDFLALSGSFGQGVDPAGSGADINGNGTVDFPDFLLLSGNFGARQEAAVDAAILSLLDADDDE